MEILVHLWSKQLLQLRVIFTNEVDVSTFVVDFFTFVVGFDKMKNFYIRGCNKSSSTSKGVFNGL